MIWALFCPATCFDSDSSTDLACLVLEWVNLPGSCTKTVVLVYEYWESVLQSVRFGPKVHGFKCTGTSIRAFSPLFARIQVLSPFLGGNGRDFLGAPLAPGKSLSVAAPLRIEGRRCLVTEYTMAGAPRIARRLPCNHIRHSRLDRESLPHHPRRPT